MRTPFSLTGRLVLSFVVLLLVSQWLNYRSATDLRVAAVQKRELDKVATLAREIEPRVRREVTWVAAVAKLVQRELANGIQLKGEAPYGSVAEALYLSYRQANLDTLEVTNDQGVVLFRAHNLASHGDVDTSWGVEEALAGKAGAASVQEGESVLVRAIEPIRVGDLIVGTVSVGRRIDGKFIAGLSDESGAELALVSRSGEVVTASRHGKTAPAPDAIAEAFQGKIPVFRTNEAQRTTLAYLPVLLVDEAWVVVAEIDSSSAYTLLDRINRESVLVALAVGLGSMLVTFLILHHALRPLRALRRRAERIVLDAQGGAAGNVKASAKVSMNANTTAPRDDLDSVVDALNMLTHVLTERNRELTEQRADLSISATAFESQEAIMIVDADMVVVRVNQAFTRITGYTSDEVVGRKPQLSNIERHNTRFCRDKWVVVNRNGSWQGEVWDRRKSGETYPKWVTATAVRNDTGALTHYVITHLDLTEMKRAEEQIRRLDLFDPLTRLPNRKLLMDRLNQAMASGQCNDMYGAVIFIDIDHFKVLNDTTGHDNGDFLLQQVARRLVACVSEEDTVARIGGDEFVVVLRCLSGDYQDAARQTEATGTALLGAFREPFSLHDSEHTTSASIGATLFHGQRASIGELLKQADLAMYKAKESGRNTLRFFDPAMQTQVMDRTALENDLRSAVAAGQFVVHYQPQVADDGRVVGAEALVRWQHPERGMVSPAEFIPLAEETGLILPLGAWVLETVCRKLSAWASREELADLAVAVNVSVRQLRHPDFVAQVRTVLASSGADPQRLKLELTESMLAENVEDVIEKMLALRTIGVRFSLDDFGTGYSSLSYLKRLPLEQLKIDQSFVRDVLTDANDASIATTIVTLAHGLGLGVIAEGVETEAQRDFLAAVGCSVYQGYYYSKPLSIAEFERFVLDREVAGVLSAPKAPVAT
jgi:diguanylate cyclase (GGDEF)-like protein/PAS domain S-box-containing protein